MSNMEFYEKQFQSYMRELLEAQEHKLSDDLSLFTPETLRRILGDFCDVIAEYLDVQSCTIHLQLYDPEEMRGSDGESLRFAGEIADRRSLTDDAEEERHCRADFIDNRTRWHKNYLTYPYWQFPKGAALLVAANKDGPWATILKKASSPHRVTVPVTGISKDIFQSSLPRIRDRYGIRSLRGFRKLGGADAELWPNDRWEHVFKNFYGVPIRIQPRSEVIGILKVENKFRRVGDEDQDKRLVAELLRCSEVDEFINKFLKEIDALGSETDVRAKASRSKEPRSERMLDISLFALAYLRYDLEAAVLQCGQSAPLAELVFIPFCVPDRGQAQNPPDLYGTLRPAQGERPPIQFLFKSQQDEERLRTCLGVEGVEAGRTFDRVWEVYTGLSKALQGRNGDYSEGGIAESIKAYLKPKLRQEGLEVRCSPAQSYKPSLPDFSYQVEIGCPNQPSLVKFLVVVIPSPEEIPKVLAHEVARCDAYLAVNRYWRGEDSQICTKGAWRRGGEHVETGGSPRAPGLSTWEAHGRVTDLVVDRLAARMQAFVDAFPFRNFDLEDTQKLSWAALQIGKLVEREIAYRANRSDDPMPITAIEFYRIPISDLALVDDLRQRRENARLVRGNIDHHMLALIDHLGMHDAIRYTSRIKDYRSFLSRIGERYEGYRRGNLAVWLYLLALLFVSKDKEAEPLEEDDTSFPAALARFRGQVEAAIEDIEELANVKERRWSASSTGFRVGNLEVAKNFFAKNHAAILGDLKFDSPPFRCATDEDRIEAYRRVSRDLVFEGLLFDGQGKLPELEAEAPPARPHDLDGEFGRCLDDLVLRDYSDFTRSAVSLLLQLRNRMVLGVDFDKFYRFCFRLRSLLCTSPRDVEDHARFAALRELYSAQSSHDNRETTWQTLVRTVDELSTGEFLSHFSSVLEKESTAGAVHPSTLGLGIAGVYKRLRSLHNTLRRQRSVASLEWDLGRFDFFGTRMNCLFKSQVFCAYESAWSRGDPFFAAQAGTKEDVPLDVREALDSRSRMRWLALRTNVLTGNYNAVQVAALVDPRAIERGFYDRRGLSLKRLQIALGQLLEKFDKSHAERYRNHGSHRRQIARRYVAWHDAARQIRLREHRPHRDEKETWFGCFLFEGVFDVVISVLDPGSPLWPGGEAEGIHRTWITPGGEAEGIYRSLIPVLEGLHRVLEWASRYTAESLRLALDSSDSLAVAAFGKDALPCRLHTSRGKCTLCEDASSGEECGLYVKAQSCLDQIRDSIPKDGRAPERWLRVLDRLKDDLVREALTFRTLFEGGSQPALWIYFPRTEKRLAEMQDRIGRVWAERPSSRRWLLELLSELRRRQKEYLFAAGEAPEPGDEVPESGLWIRGREEVLSRIKNLVHLFRPEDLEASGDETFAALTPYDLFHYLRSLVPIEVQFRTELANTVAEQYHDTVYKGRPPVGTEIARRQIELMGERVDEIDLELEVDYEDYITRYQMDLLRQAEAEDLGSSDGETD